MSIAFAPSAQCEVLVDFAPLEPTVANMFVAAEVDSTMFMPSQFKLVFRGKPDEVLIPGGLQLAVPVTVSATYDGVPVPMITGEVTAVEIDYAHGETLTIVRGMDRSHRLMRGNQTMAYPDMTASTVVESLCGEAEVEALAIPTSGIYPWLTQANVSAWTFIQQLAMLENCIAYTDALGVLQFCPMPKPEEAGPPAMTNALPPEPTQLVMGVNIERIRAVVSAAEQVPSVVATGWDPTLTMPVVGPAPNVPSTSMSLDPATEPPLIGAEFGAGLLYDASRVFDSEGAAMKYAESVAADLAGALSEFEAECLGNPNLLAGKPISLGQAGPPFDGTYVVSAARHVFDFGENGYTTWVTVGGYRDRSLLALTSGGHAAEGHRPNISGLVIGTVMDNADPMEQGRVTLRFPWLDPEYVSNWARVMQIGASGEGAGFLWIPEINDEVIVGFDRGSIEHPFVIGGLYNGVSMPIPPPSVEAGVANRRISSRVAHTIQWNDGPPGPSGISISTAPAEGSPASIVLDGEEAQVTVNADGQIQITGAAGVTIKSEGPLSIQGETVEIGGPTCSSVTIGGMAVSVGGGDTTSIEITSSADVSVSGAMITLGGA